MSTTTIPAQKTSTEDHFESSQVYSLSSGHALHDTFSAFLATLIPELRTVFSLTLTQAGWLSAAMTLPAVLNPLIGYLDERINLRWLVLLAPAVTATALSAMGVMPNYVALLLLLSLAGFSSAVFHAIAPALIAQYSGMRTGRGMSVFMAAGETGRSLGPIIAAWAAGTLTLHKMWPLASIAWVVSIFLIIRLGHLPAAPRRQTSLRGLAPRAWRLFFPIILLTFSRNFLVNALGTFLPSLLESEGASLLQGGIALAIYQLAGIAGALAGGSLSDRFGRRSVLLAAMLISSTVTFLFLNTSGLISLGILVIIGGTNLAVQPIMLALVQDHFPEARSMANGIYLGITFISFAITAVLIGWVGEMTGLREAFYICAAISLLSLPLLYLLPQK
jgi:FSR family fosmidomycin resistance protein-like MFS transporter